MEVFVIMDKALLGRGVFGVFSDRARAEAYLRGPMALDAPLCEVRRLVLDAQSSSGSEGEARPGTVFAAYTYDRLYDQTIFDGLYADLPSARDAAGDSGLVVRFLINDPETKETIKLEP